MREPEPSADERVVADHACRAWSASRTAAATRPHGDGGPPSAACALPLPLEDPTSLTLKHGGRILDGDLYATASRVDGAVLLQRSFGFDALRCPGGILPWEFEKSGLGSILRRSRSP